MYGAREHANAAGITNEEVLAAIQAYQPQTQLVQDKAMALATLKKEAKPGDVVIVMAVGSFNRLAYELAA
jgi:UDP-N-acetylmuramate-alanine ligase